ncbi:MAG TPA: VWA domain-containing protein [Epulopiscium sp.]|nr:VWA domain-containing protein [Candidatus Epulonipiscium sp.]
MSGTPIANAKHAARSFVNAMYSKDRIGIITFNSSAQTIADMTYAKNDTKKEELKQLINTKITASGGTATNTGLNKALEMLQDNSTLNKKIIVLLCDGDVQDPSEVIKKAKENNIKIYTVNFGSSGTDKLSEMAKDTGGKCYNAKTAEQLLKAFYDIEQETYAEIDMTDTDGDGLPDVFEVIGMQLTNGKMVTSDPTKKDTDYDGLTDYEEMGRYIIDKKVYLGDGKYAYKIHFNGKSDPRKKDTDGDGYNDPDDSRPLISDVKYCNLTSTDYFTVLDSPDVKKNYGGSQGWFKTSNKLRADYLISEVGCGVIGLSDLFIYLNNKDPNLYKDLMLENKVNSGKIEYEDYRSFVRWINHSYTNVMRGVGVLGPKMASSANNYFRYTNKNINKNASKENKIML